MSRFIPEPNQIQEEPLQPVFEKNKTYLNSKTTSLKLAKEELFQDQNIFSRLAAWINQHQLATLGSFATIAVVVGILVSLLLTSQNSGVTPVQLFNGVNVSAQEVTLEPTEQDSLGTSTTSSYIIKFTNPIELQALKDNLVVTPNRDFGITKISTTEYKIDLKSPLSPKETVRFSLKANIQSEIPSQSLEWAFQAKDEFRIVQHLPADQALRVPTNSGIELVFNTDKYQDPKEYFSISPKVDGKFQRNGQTLTFIPEKLNPETLYKVSLKSGLGLDGSKETLKESISFEFETDAGEEKANGIYNDFIFSRDFYEFNDSIKPAFEVSAVDDSKLKNAQVTVYNYSDFNTFKDQASSLLNIPDWTLFAQNNFNTDTSKLSKIQTFKPVFSSTTGNYVNQFELPNKLNKGYYLVELKTPSKTQYTFLQISNFSVALQESIDTSFAWVVNLNDNKPLAGAKLEGTDSTLIATTNAQGLATFKSPLKPNDVFYSLRNEDFRMLIPRYAYLNFSSSLENNQINRYWSYLFTDRDIYKPTDKVNIWGFIKPRADSQLPKLKAVLKKFNELGAATNISQKDINLNEFSFTEVFSLDQVNSGFYYIDIQTPEGDVIASRGFNVDIYSKPTYKIELTTDKKAYFAGEVVKYSGRTLFYDGTPVPNIALEISGDSGIDPKSQVVTNNKGEFSYSEKIQPSPDFNTDGQRSKYIQAGSLFAEEFPIYGSIYTKYFDYKSYLDIQTSTQGTAAKVKLQFNQVDLNKLELTDDFKGAPIANKAISVRANEYIYEAVENGSYYDLYTKTTQKTYDFVKKLVGSKDFTTNTKADGSAEVNFDTTPNSFYELEVVANDLDGTRMFFRKGLNAGIYNSNGEKFKLLVDSKNVWEGAPYSVGQPIKIEIVENNKPTPNNLYLIYTAQNGIKEVEVTDKNSIEKTFQENYIPNTNLGAVVLSGGKFYNLYTTELTFDYTQKKLNINLEADKPTYKPGEQVNLKIKVTDEKNQGVEAFTNLSVVDLAFLDLTSYTGYEADIFDSLYKYLPSGNTYSYISHDYINLNERGGMGNGGGARNDFSDTATFQTIKTDKNGDGLVSFKLPDNITSYQVLAQAISKDLQVGKTEQKIVANLPYFVNVVNSDQYLVNDQPTIKIRSFGSQINPSTPVTYTVSVPKLGINQEIKNLVSESAEIALPPLQAGEYEIIVKGATSDFSDSISKKFSVISNYTQKIVTKFEEYTTQTKIQTSENSTDIYLSNFNTGEIFTYLASVSQTSGQRIDQKVTANIASQILSKAKLGQETTTVVNTNIQDYQTVQGGLGIYAYADNDLTTTINIAALSRKNKFSLDYLSIKEYLNDILSSSKESRFRKIQALYGLSGIDTDTLNQIKSAASIQDLSFTESLYLGIALIQSGDKEGGRETITLAIQKYLQNNIENIYTLENDPNLSRNEINLLTATALSKIDDVKAYTIYRNYLQSPADLAQPLYLENILFSQSWLDKPVSQTVEFSYELDGQKLTSRLSNSQILPLTLNSTQIAALNIQVSSGQLGINTISKVGFDAPLEIGSKKLSISRRYSVNGKTSNTFKDGDLVKITLTISKTTATDTKCQQISDFLPSGLRISNQSQRYQGIPETVSDPYLIEGQKVSFCLPKSQNEVSYFAKIVSKGSFTADSAIAQSVEVLSDIAASGKAKIEIS